MKIRIHEIEMGSDDLTNTTSFFKTLGLHPAIEQAALTVFNSGQQGVDVNVSKHLAKGITQISFITDDLKAMMQHLTTHQISFQGPFESHLGMLCIRLITPDGIPVVINTPTDSSPSWLQV
ncbi:hypothetical protein KACHI17_08760 [Sediminibacterium sp. KACHI17]|uniref:VOC family protein n=1 Tax=Sediminibacterium sp. KACHI17 TaxID=1751071 RepID=A0AAT9GHM1_9BACT